MAAFADRFKGENSSKFPEFEHLEWMLDVCPSTREVLTGVYQDDGTVIVKPCSILIWSESCRLKYLINAMSTNEKGWGVFSDPRKPWESIELALIKGDVDWKPAQKSQTELTGLY